MIEITHVEIQHSNASMGPHETRVEIGLGRQGYEENFDKLATETTINGVMSLGEFLTLHKEGKKEELQKVLDAFEVDQDSLSVGGGESALVFSIKDGPSYRFGDLRYYQITGYYYSDFQKILVEKGHRHEWRPWDGPGGPDEEIRLEEFDTSTANINDLSNEPLLSKLKDIDDDPFGEES